MFHRRYNLQHGYWHYESFNSLVRVFMNNHDDNIQVAKQVLHDEETVALSD
jgi:hypothetical protein